MLSVLSIRRLLHRCLYQGYLLCEPVALHQSLDELHHYPEELIRHPYLLTLEIRVGEQHQVQRVNGLVGQCLDGDLSQRCADISLHEIEFGLEPEQHQQQLDHLLHHLRLIILDGESDRCILLFSEIGY